VQSTAVAFEEVNERNVYLCTGQPLPTDIAKIVEWMLNEDFSTAYQSKNTTLFVNFHALGANLSSSGRFVWTGIVCITGSV
jgi:diphthamide synthase subunit DPH2